MHMRECAKCLIEHVSSHNILKQYTLEQIKAATKQFKKKWNHGGLTELGLYVYI